MSNSKAHIAQILFILTVSSIPIQLENLFAGEICINEVMSANLQTLADEDGDYPDWIELYNAGDAGIDLEGMGLSDNGSRPFKWVFPEYVLEGRSHFIVFASAKNRAELKYWSTLVDWPEVWRYRLGDTEPPTDWNAVGFDDASWSEGESGFGYSDGDDNTIIPTTISVYIRKKFEIKNVEEITEALLHVDYDDGFVAYLNGCEIARSNVGFVGRPPAHDETASASHEASMISGGQPDKFVIADPRGILREGDNVLALQGHNQNITSSDLTLIPLFTVARRSPSEEQQPPPAFLHLEATNLHTNFKVKSAGEILYLSEPSGSLADMVEVISLPGDASFGRYPDGANDFHAMAVPTPGTANRDSVITEKTPAPLFSSAGGFYGGEVVLTIASAQPKTEIFYTLDGSEPDQSALPFTEPLVLNSTSVFRAVALQKGLLPSQIETHTFIIDETTKLPVVCLTTDPYNLWDEEYGIYVMGPNAEPEDPNFGANFWQDWERPVHVEFFESDRQSGFRLDAGMKIYGGWSRARPQKSVSIFARRKYGENEIRYRLFPDKEIDSFEAFVLRNSGNDWTHTMIRDGFMQGLIKKDMDLETMAFRPSVVYLNGEYWGILNIREKINEHFIAANSGVSAEKIDLLSNSGTLGGDVITGSNTAYIDLLAYLENHDLSDTESFGYAASQIDIDNFLEYNIAQIYFDNTDWPGNNIKYWRCNDPPGRWRWLIFDTDFGFGLYGNSNYMNNTLAFATEPDGPGWPNPSWSTFILRKLLENGYFKRRFISKFADHLNTTFEPQHVIDFVDEMASVIESEIPQHNRKWRESAGSWKNRLQVLKTFAERRPQYMREHIRSYFDLEDVYRLTIRIGQPGTGSVAVNSQVLRDFPWTGYYFEGVPVQLTARPKAGYRFSRWSDSQLDRSISVSLDLTEDATLTAYFEPDTLASAAVVINEINYNSSADRDPGDWLELAGTSDASVDLTGWVLRDSDVEHIYTFPAGSFLPARGYFVICRDTVLFKKIHYLREGYAGNLSFGINDGGEELLLFDRDGILVDSLSFDDEDPWPEEADGLGFTLELKEPYLDNGKAASWTRSRSVGGSPGRSNSSVTVVEEEAAPVAGYSLEQNYPNPFNSTTTITYSLQMDSRVDLSVFDITGHMVSRIVDEKQGAGLYTLLWAPNLPTGVYFYRLRAGGNGHRFLDIKKMVLVR